MPGQPLPRPFVAILVDSGNNRLANIPITFTATEGSGNYGSLSKKTVTTDSDGRAAVTLTLGPDEGIENNRVEATFPGNTGLPVVFAASAMVPGDALQTSISGVALDNSDIPVPGATIRILGTSRTGVSDAQGQFLIKPVPVGTLRMAVDGSTVTRPGSSVNLDYNITTVAGHDNDPSPSPTGAASRAPPPSPTPTKPPKSPTSASSPASSSVSIPKAAPSIPPPRCASRISTATRRARRPRCIPSRFLRIFGGQLVGR